MKDTILIGQEILFGLASLMVGLIAALFKKKKKEKED